jgi:WD40 repeat protein
MERRLEEYTAAASSVAVTADGTQAIAGYEDGSLIVWGLNTGQLERRLEGHWDAVVSLAIINNLACLVSVSDDAMIVWDLQLGRTKPRPERHSAAVRSVAVTTNGAWAVSGSEDRSVIVWDLNRGRSEWRLDARTSIPRSVAITDDGRWVISRSDDGRFIAWDITTGHVESGFDPPSALLAYEDGGAMVQHLISGEETERQLKTHVRSVVVAAGGNRAISWADDGTLIVRNFKTGEMEHRLEVPWASVGSMAITKDAAWMVAGFEDCTIRLWHLATGRCLGTFTLDAPVNALAVSAGDPFCVVAGDPRGTMHFFVLQSAAAGPSA